MQFRVFSPFFSDGYRDVIADSKEEADLWFLSLGIDDCEYRIVSLSRGGARPGAGRPKNSKGTGKWAGQKTKAIRVPEKIADNIENLSQAYDSLHSLADFFHKQADEAKAQSKTSQYPRTWDKALQLLKEIDEIPAKENFVV